MERLGLSDSQRRWLHEQLDAWVARGIITPETRQQIDSQYETADDTANRRQRVLVFTILGLAAVLVGAAAMLLVGHNWDALPRAGKLVMVLATVAGFHALGHWLRFVRGWQRLGEVVLFLACVFYGVGIWLIAQAFHLDSHYPDGVWWWAIGVLPVALCLDTLLTHALLVGLLGTWVGMEVMGFGHLGPFWGRVPNGAYSLPLLALPGILWAYRRSSPRALGLYVLLLGWWLTLQGVAWNVGGLIVILIGTCGMMMLVIADTHRAGSPMAEPWRNIGFVLTAGVMLPLSFKDFYNSSVLRGWNHTRVEMDGAMFGLAVVGGLIACVIAVHVMRRGWDAIRQQWVGALVAGALVFSMIALLTSNYASGGNRADYGPLAVPAAAVANVAMVAMAIAVMRRGLHVSRGRLFTMGVLYFLLWTLLRYIDLFGKFAGMVGAACLFLVCAALLFGLAWLWRVRKEPAHV